MCLLFINIMVMADEKQSSNFVVSIASNYRRQCPRPHVPYVSLTVLRTNLRQISASCSSPEFSWSPSLFDRTCMIQKMMMSDMRPRPKMEEKLTPPCNAG